jgi:hypothetical protein
VVAGALADAGRATVAELVAAVYADVDAERHRVARYSLWAHLRYLADQGRARCSTDIGDRGADLYGVWEPVAPG